MSKAWYYISRHWFSIIIYAFYLCMWLATVPIQIASRKRLLADTPHPHCDFTSIMYIPIMLIALAYAFVMFINMTFKKDDGRFYGVMIILTLAPFPLLYL